MGEHRASSHRVLVVDDNAMLRQLVRLWLESFADIEVVADVGDGQAAVDIAPRCHPDVVLMDVDMPRMSGPEATRKLLEECPNTCVIAYTGHVSGEPVTRMIVAGAKGYAVKGEDPTRLANAIRAAARGDVQLDPRALPGIFDGVLQLAREEQTRRVERERLHSELEDSYRDTVRALAAALDMRDDATHDHADRVARRAVAVGRRLDLRGKQLVDLEYGALFHDVGKIAVPDSILLNSRELTPEEWTIIRRHTIYGEQIIRPVRFLRNVGRIVRHSHERWDGTGYPDGLAGNDIPLESRIVMACDAFDVMTGGRRYQRALSLSVAVSRMRRDSGTHFDPRVVDALVSVVLDERRDERETPLAHQHH